MSYTDYSNYYDADYNPVQNLTNGKMKCHTLWYCYCGDDYCCDDINEEVCTNLYKSIECNKEKGTEYYEHYYDQLAIPYANYQDPSSAQNFMIEILVSNVQNPTINRFDPNLINPWGIIILNDNVWIANAGSGLITNYNVRGETSMLPITVYGPGSIIMQPVGLVRNSNNNSFIVSSGLLSGPSTIITVTLNGTIHGYSNMVDPKNSILVINNIGIGAIYTGVTLVKNILYVANFGNKRIDVFNNNFEPLMGYFFIDRCKHNPIPSDYSPYNIVNVGDYLYVTYVKQNSVSKLEIIGSDNGYINIFTIDGEFVKRFVSQDGLNTPWGLIEAPTVFCYPPGTILVSNFGNGKINAYTHDGYLLGRVLDGNCNEICIDGLRGLVSNNNYDPKIYFTSTSYNLKIGTFGNINIGNNTTTNVNITNFCPLK